MTYNALLEHLKSCSDDKFAAFSKTLSNSDYKVIGVKNPVLRQIIKDHKNDSELNTDDFKIGEYLEIDFIYFGLSLSRLKTNKDKLSFLNKKIRFARSWAITDTVATYFKKLNFEEYWSFFLKTYSSSHIYERRTAYVLGLKLYKDKQILDVINFINENENYIVMMAEAWVLATIAITYPKEIYEFLAKTKDIVLTRKTISKICDSFRFDETTKEKFKQLRKEL